jgi:hypothetical protein
MQGFTLDRSAGGIGHSRTGPDGRDAGQRVTHPATRNGRADAMLGQICADNAFVQLRLAQQLPSVGVTHLACEQAARLSMSL